MISSAVWISACASVALLLGSCDETGAERSAAAVQPPAVKARTETCGGDMPKGTMSAWFARLEHHLETSSAPVPLEFYTDVVALTQADRTLRFRTADMGPQAVRLPTLEEWREISRRGVRSLHDAGYRGCYFSTGKAWFNTNFADGRFGLAGFDRDREWTPD